MKTLLSALLACALSGAPALAACVTVAPGLPGWERLDFDDIPSNTWREEGGALVASSSASASMLYARTPATAAPVLSWRWRVDRAVPATDLTRKGGDDRSLALTVGFAYDPANASLGERMRRVMVETVAGADAPGRIVDFVWGGAHPVGTRFESPYSGSASRTIILQSATAPTGQWATERVDLSSLYRELWGSDMPPVTQVAVFIDTDDTGVTGEGRVADICLSAD